MIDILTASGKAPIIVGDEGDMAALVTLEQPRADQAWLSFGDAQGMTTKLDISWEVAEVFSVATHVCLAALAGDDIVYARLWDISAGSGRALADAEIKDLTEQLVEGEFRLTHFRSVRVGT